MNAKRFLFVVLAVALLAAALGLFGVVPTLAQDSEVALPEALEEAYASELWLETPELVEVGADVNLRMSPTTKRNSPLGTIQAGSLAQILAREPNGENGAWTLVRWFNTSGMYGGFGWISDSVAQMTPYTSEVHLARPMCNVTGGVRATGGSIAFGEGWLFDTFSSACAQLFEGRFDNTRQHEIVILSQTRLDEEGNLVSELYNEAMTEFDLFWYHEGSYWLYPRGWNMQENLEDEPSIASMFAADKRKNQEEAKVPVWPIQIWSTEGLVVERFETGQGPNVETTPSCDLIDDPQPVAVNAIFNSRNSSFSGSIGRAGCSYVLVVMKAGQTDYSVETWEGVKENYAFSQVFVLELPSSWVDNDSRIATAVQSVFVQLPDGATVHTNGLFGLPDEITVDNN